MNLTLDKDAWSSGQIGSKLWLCREIERIPGDKPATIWILGGWYGLLSHLLLVREKMTISKVRSFDINPECASHADLINELYVWQNWTFKAFTADCGRLNYESPGEWASERPDWVINTSMEHFESLDWWHRIPSGTRVAVQNTDMPHTDHRFGAQSADELASIVPMQQTHFKGSLHFDYGNKSSFSRFMLIGIK